MNCLAIKCHMTDAIHMFQLMDKKQELAIQSLQLDISDVKTDLNKLVESVDLLRTEIKSTKSNIMHLPVYL